MYIYTHRICTQVYVCVRVTVCVRFSEYVCIDVYAWTFVRVNAHARPCGHIFLLKKTWMSKQVCLWVLKCGRTRVCVSMCTCVLRFSYRGFLTSKKLKEHVHFLWSPMKLLNSWRSQQQILGISIFETLLYANQHSNNFQRHVVNAFLYFKYFTSKSSETFSRTQFHSSFGIASRPFG